MWTEDDFDPAFYRDSQGGILQPVRGILARTEQAVGSTE